MSVTVTPTGLVKHSGEIVLPGGLSAKIAWFKDTMEGEIYVSPTWERNADAVARNKAFSRAENAAGCDGIEWKFITG